jgi:hypothetical protein
VIYFIRDESNGTIKIGTTVCLTDRLKQLESEVNEDLDVKAGLRVLAVVPGSYADERALHKRFDYCRDHGEWFNPVSELTDLIRTDGQPWDGTDEVSSVTTKMDPEVVRIAKMAATGQKLSLYNYLNKIVRPVAVKDAKHAAAHLDDQEDGKAKKARK